MTDDDASVSLALALHGVRILGFANSDAVARRWGLSSDAVDEALGDAEACGWVTFASFAGLSGWSLTDRGRRENERRLTEELARVDGEHRLKRVYSDFLPVNATLLTACTNWQLRPASDGRLASNDHTDLEWDARVLRELGEIEHELTSISENLESILSRFGGYDVRYAAALRRARRGEHEWVDGTAVDSCHRVWFELHEDLIATLGIDRNVET
ncbi:transcriptional regulator [Paramicrobacterium chengjingii]|uniref:Transcriptional regulator n=1 Tax=Paramicrobacterium chengjingii TaxID=2769067 RepID=A0ABX6YGI1_9MICO|nr:transcriptional regulator [Microbacterium chengjingii]QPZ37898.1 transcriptional regulator [Microbacterium chengjingii]